MAYIHFDRSYAPCGFLIVRTGGDPYKAADARLIQTDWDFPGVASRMGLEPCICGATDGTIDCAHKKAHDMISDAYDFISEREGVEFAELNEYIE